MPLQGHIPVSYALMFFRNRPPWGIGDYLLVLSTEAGILYFTIYTSGHLGMLPGEPV